MTSAEAQALIQGIQSNAPERNARERAELFQQLFDAFFPKTVYFYHRRGVSRSDAEDLAQKVFLRVYQGIDGFRHDAGFKTWLLRIADNLWKNFLRDQDAEKRKADEISIDDNRPDEQAPAQKLADSRKGPLDKALDAEGARVLQEALDELPERMRECVSLRYQGRAYKEIAVILKIKPSTVKSQLKEAKKRLRPKLAAYFRDDALDDPELDKEEDHG